MRTFRNETSKESNTVNTQKFGSRSFPLFNWLHLLLLVIWWFCGWVSGMRSSFRKTKVDFETLALSDVRNLRLLQLNYVQLGGSYKNFPQGLRWLCMHGFPLRYIPSDLQMENMVALDMSNSKLKHLWKKPKLLRFLKFLNLSSCRQLVSVGHFSSLPLLERLTLVGCTSLIEVCESIGSYCQNLEVLDLSKCNKLKELPRSIGKLKNLTQLLIDGCSNLGEFPVEMKDMEALKILIADNVNIKSHTFFSFSAIVEVIPRSSMFSVISLPRSLVTLSLKNNNLSNESFPIDFTSLPVLRELYLDNNTVSSMPECVRSLSRLETLSFDSCGNLKTVFCAPDKLKYLRIYNCHSLEKITFNPEKSAPSEVAYFDASTVTEIQDRFKMQALSDVDEDILCGLGWVNIEYLNYCQLSMADCDRCYHYTEKKFPMQMLYEHGIFSTYLQGQEVPKWFTHKSNGSLFTLQSSPKNSKIQGRNVCIVRTISSIMDVGPPRIEIRNLTKNSSWTYQPIMYVLPEEDDFEYGDHIVVWLSHWLFGKNEFEDGDEVSIQFTVKYCYPHNSECWIRYDSEGPDYANVREYGINLVYDYGENQKEDPLGYYKSWKHIIGGDISAAEVSSSHYLLKPWPNELPLISSSK